MKVGSGAVTIVLSIASGILASIATYYEAKSAATECKEEFNQVMNELLDEDRTKAS